MSQRRRSCLKSKPEAGEDTTVGGESTFKGPVLSQTTNRRVSFSAKNHIKEYNCNVSAENVEGSPSGMEMTRTDCPGLDLADTTYAGDMSMLDSVFKENTLGNWSLNASSMDMSTLGGSYLPYDNVTTAEDNDVSYSCAVEMDVPPVEELRRRNDTAVSLMMSYSAMNMTAGPPFKTATILGTSSGSEMNMTTAKMYHPADTTTEAKIEIITANDTMSASGERSHSAADATINKPYSCNSVMDETNVINKTFTLPPRDYKIYDVMNETKIVHDSEYTRSLAINVPSISASVEALRPSQPNVDLREQNLQVSTESVDYSLSPMGLIDSPNFEDMSLMEPILEENTVKDWNLTTAMDLTTATVRSHRPCNPTAISKDTTAVVDRSSRPYDPTAISKHVTPDGENNRGQDATLDTLACPDHNETAAGGSNLVNDTMEEIIMSNAVMEMTTAAYRPKDFTEYKASPGSVMDETNFSKVTFTRPSYNKLVGKSYIFEESQLMPAPSESNNSVSGMKKRRKVPSTKAIALPDNSLFGKFGSAKTPKRMMPQDMFKMPISTKLRPRDESSKALESQTIPLGRAVLKTEMSKHEELKHSEATGPYPPAAHYSANVASSISRGPLERSKKPLKPNVETAAELPAAEPSFAFPDKSPVCSSPPDQKTLVVSTKVNTIVNISPARVASCSPLQSPIPSPIVPSKKLEPPKVTLLTKINTTVVIPTASTESSKYIASPVASTSSIASSNQQKRVNNVVTSTKVQTSSGVPFAESVNHLSRVTTSPASSCRMGLERPEVTTNQNIKTEVVTPKPNVSNATAVSPDVSFTCNNQLKTPNLVVSPNANLSEVMLPRTESSDIGETPEKRREEVMEMEMSQNIEKIFAPCEFSKYSSFSRTLEDFSASKVEFIDESMDMFEDDEDEVVVEIPDTRPLRYSHALNSDTLARIQEIKRLAGHKKLSAMQYFVLELRAMTDQDFLASLEQLAGFVHPTWLEAQRKYRELIKINKGEVGPLEVFAKARFTKACKQKHLTPLLPFTHPQ